MAGWLREIACAFVSLLKGFVLLLLLTLVAVALPLIAILMLVAWGGAVAARSMGASRAVADAPLATASAMIEPVGLAIDALRIVVRRLDGLAVDLDERGGRIECSSSVGADSEAAALS